MGDTEAPGTSRRHQSLLNIGHGHVVRQGSLAHCSQLQSVNIHKYSAVYTIDKLYMSLLILNHMLIMEI